MSVVESEAISDTGHVLDVLSHVVPKVRRVTRAGAISQFDVVSPDIDVSSQVVPSLHSKVLHAIPATDPAVVGNLGSLSVVELRKVWLNEPVDCSDL